MSNSLNVPASRTPARISRRLVRAQHLPAEVVLHILGYAVPTIYDKAIKFRQDPSAFFENVTPAFLSILKGTQSSLRNATLVCRAWYPASNELLYACPFLSSLGGVALFGRTLQATPELGERVHQVPEHLELVHGTALVVATVGQRLVEHLLERP